MKIILAFIILCTIAFSKEIKTLKWEDGISFISFLGQQSISKDIYFNLTKEDKELCSEIKAGQKYKVSYKNGTIEDILIPISEDMQIYIYNTNEKYKIKLVPIKYTKFTDVLVVDIATSPYNDIVHFTHNKRLANEFVRNFNKLFNFKALHKNDKLVIKYIQKVRLGNYYGTPNILAAGIIFRNNEKIIYKNPKDGRYYDKNGKSLSSMFFKVPVRYKRISSKFTYKRFHPILHRYIAHLGIDYAAPRGTIIKAAGDGRIVFRGRKGGYGNTIIIKHKGGYKTLYAHQSKFYNRLKRGSFVRQGQRIGYVGTSGRSTGPHLHFGLYKNGKAINPNSVITYSKDVLTGKTKRNFVSFVKEVDKEFETTIKNNKMPYDLKHENLYSNLDLNITSDNDFTIRIP